MTNVKLTRYYMVTEDMYGTDKSIPVLDAQRNTIAMVDPEFFAAMSLEGSAKLDSGQVLNVSGGYTSCPPDAAATLKAIADKQYRSHYGYVGLSNDCTRYFTYNVSPTIWGVGSHNFSLVPFVSVASDPRFYPFGTVLFIPALKDQQMPDGTQHMGYVECCDTGSAIIGEHLDWFVGYKKWEMNDTIPENVDVEVYTAPSNS